MRRMQDALCPACGAVFRTRAHSIECVEAPLDPRYLDIAITLTKEKAEEVRREVKDGND